MLIYIFRPRYPSLHWRPRTAADLLNRKLIHIWRGSQVDSQALDVSTKRE